MTEIDVGLVPEGMSIVHVVTPHCFVNEDGHIVFLRKHKSGYVPVVLQTVYDAISQSFHILDRTVGEVVDFYHRQPSIRTEGEIGQMRNAVLKIQSAIADLISPEGVSERSAEEIAVTFGQIIRRLGYVRNAHKRALVANLNQTARGNGPKHLGEIFAPAAAHLAAINRFDELSRIVKGVVDQARQLIHIARHAEDRIRRVYEVLGAYESRVGRIVIEVERVQREAGVRCPPSQLSLLRQIAHEVSRPGSNRVVNALKGIVLVEPFKSRIESEDVRRLAHLDEYLDKWQEGKDQALYTFWRTFGAARGRLKRLVRERRAIREQRVLERQYTTQVTA